MKTLVILCAPCGVGKSTVKEIIAQLFIDNTNQTVEETAQLIENFIKNLENVG